MDLICILFGLSAALFRRGKHDADLDEELRSHIDLAVEESLERGKLEQEARTTALREFGGITQTKERYRSQRGLLSLERLARDIQIAFRQLRKSPGFTLIVVLMLALGIGANTAVFSVMNAILMQLLPVSRPEGLSYVHIADSQFQPSGAGNTGDSGTSFSEPVFEALRQRGDVFEELIAFVPLSTSGSVAVRHGELPEEAKGEEVSGNFFSGVGARLERGRGFTWQDEKDHASAVVAGVGIGIVSGLILTRLMATLLFGVNSTDPFTFSVVAILLLLVALLASYIPARRAMRIDPMRALRTE